MNIKGKKILVMGLGLHGGGAAVAGWLARRGAIVTVTDLKTKAQLQSSINQLRALKINWVLGKHRQVDFIKADMLVQNPGVPRDSKYLAIARRRGIPIENDASLFFKHCRGIIVGVTGTRGKSTTATLIHQFLPKSFLVGLPQQPMLATVDKIKPTDVVVVELSSWQLEILGQQGISPSVAVVTNIYPDHLNRYAGIEDYAAAKKNIFLHQQPGDAVVLNKDNTFTRQMGREASSARFWTSKNFFPEANGSYIKNGQVIFRRDGRLTRLFALGDIKSAQRLNLDDILLAATAAGVVRLNTKRFKQVVKMFTGLPGRLDTLGKIASVEYINDTTSTMPDATIFALNQFKDKKTILIAGGDFKNIPDLKYQELAKVIKQKCKAVVLFSGRGSQQLLAQLKFSPLVSQVNNMTEAVGLAQSFAQRGDRVLLSPACASFNLFINEFDRGDQFVQAVVVLKQKQDK